MVVLTLLVRAKMGFTRFRASPWLRAGWAATFEVPSLMVEMRSEEAPTMADVSPPV
jgi:hypothetical protein